jgi:spore coat polysaccharide biosynthesis protein SpsF
MRESLRTVGIIQARMTSSRLPGKILMEVMGRPLLAYELERLQRTPEMDEIIVATTVNREDDPVAALCGSLGIKCFRGSEEDVLSRYYEAATLYEADIVVRFTADCPLIDPGLASEVISLYLNSGEFDFVGIDYTRMPRGMDVEIFSYNTLKDAHERGRSAPDREHVTWYIYNSGDRFKVHRHGWAENWSGYRLTVDTAADFSLIEAILKELSPANPSFSLRDVIDLLEKRPDLSRLNEGVVHKTVTV